jgi:hypothetical protein
MPHEVDHDLPAELSADEDALLAQMPAWTTSATHAAPS